MGKASLVARPIVDEELDSWDRLASVHGTVFDSLRWTGLFGHNLKRVGIYDRGDNLRGGFSVFEQRRFGMKLIRNPPFTRQVGPFFEHRATNPAARTSEQRDVVEAVAEYIDSLKAPVVSVGLSLGVDDCLPFRWRDYKVVPHYTYRIDLRNSSEEIFAAFSKERRNDIRKAKKDEIEAFEEKDANTLGSLVVETFSRQEKFFPRQPMDAVLNAFPPGNGAFCFVSREKNDPAAGVYVVHDARTAYYLMGGYRQNAHHGAGALAMYRAIIKAKELGLDFFDFEGSIIPTIERYFRGFGGQLTPLFSVNKAWLPLEIVLKFIKRDAF